MELLDAISKSVTTLEVRVADQKQRARQREEHVRQCEDTTAQMRGKLDDATARLTARETAVEWLNEQVGQAVTERRKAELQLEEARSKLADAARAKADLQSAQSSIKARQQELTAMAKRLEKVEKANSIATEQRNWLVELYTVLAGRPSWWVLMPQEWRNRREHELLRRNKVFDAKRYLERYPDVSAAGMDPVRHYIMHGMIEGRRFDR
ncbi:hypothetical protein [Sphingomonas sp. KC8]|uniref:hypothetical protein n=1 Tax=Sphingomonas sp. KC8 TaxID=1030157 RepID=UPI0002489F7C|nr:hypothetical protein [Sphingomonas sp. KC8]ARS28213.1 hypothetical protein KC8_13100 [Sphingomonas sp. KC8]